MINERIQPPNAVKVITGTHPDNYTNVLEGVAETYIRTFGDTEGVYEGAIHKDGSIIPLNKFINFYTPKTEDTEIKFDSTQAIAFIRWIENFPQESVENATGGYHPYYKHSDVVNRFKTDMIPSNDSVPIIVYWGDDEFNVCGF